jgi:putative addiction module component (TIGR02574 family)
MNNHSTQLFQDALRLPEKERADLAAQLIDSLDPSQEEDVETAWDQEIRRRIEELRTGQATAIPWPEARRLILEDTDDSAAD